MNNKRMRAGGLCLVIAVMFYALGFSKISFIADNTNVTIYPAIALALAGVLLIVSNWWGRQQEA